MGKIDFKKVRQWAIMGAIAGVATPLLLKLISMVFSAIPGVSVQLQSISVSGQVSQAVNTGLGGIAKKLLGLVPMQLPTGPEWIYVALGGAAFFVLGYIIVEMLNMYSGSKLKKIVSIMLLSGILSGWILSMAITLPALTAIVMMLVDALVLGFIFVQVDKGMKGKLIPN